MADDEAAAQWQHEVPGTRWLRADLHVHTLDDHPGSKVKRPPGLSGPADSPDVQTGYARGLLHSAIRQGIQVIGLTPHAVRSGDSAATSCTWRVVEEWKSGLDDSGRPFRHSIFAVYPGFEPSLNSGRAGVHLAFLFDPSIGHELYDRAFYAVMAGASPYDDNGQLRNSTLKTIDDAITALDGIPVGTPGETSYICLAPHASTGKGLLSAQKSQVLAAFPTHRLSGIEMKDSWLPDDELKDREWLREAMREHHLAFFHASDAYTLPAAGDEPALQSLGFRTTLIKLATPTIEALRQAFLAQDARVRIEYERSGDSLRRRSDLPSPTASGRKWIRSVTVTGDASFLAGATVPLSPDLTCLIGASMSGKSTLLDGVRVAGGYALPESRSLRDEVEARANSSLLLGGAVIEADVPGATSTDADLLQRCPGIFLAQGELRDLGKSQAGLRSLLFRMRSGSAAELGAQRAELLRLDGELDSQIPPIVDARDALDTAAEALRASQAATDALKSFEDAGGGDLIAAQRDAALVDRLNKVVNLARDAVVGTKQRLTAIKMPDVASAEVRSAPNAAMGGSTLDDAVAGAQAGVDAVVADIARICAGVEAMLAAANTRATQIETRVRARLVEAGRPPDVLDQFERVKANAASLETDTQTHLNAQTAFDTLIARFSRMETERRELETKHRGALHVIAKELTQRFAGELSVRIAPEDVRDGFEDWILGLKLGGLTRWWNSQVPRRCTLSTFREARTTGRHALVEMSNQVAETLDDNMTTRRELELRALRCDDGISIVARGPDGREKSLGALSGGRRASVLLNLLLESDDDRLLVIDQPEDDIDGRFLSGALLQALRRLKGRRQVVLATHSANLVVNGDADLVVVLDSDGKRGRVEVAGAIEERGVRDAIIEKLDGGPDAFRRRRAKYNF